MLVGMDEAGLGPNLGPFVVAATVWDVPGPAAEHDLFQSLASAVSPMATKDGRIHVADSKQVFSPSRGLAGLECSALALLMQAFSCKTFAELLSDVSPVTAAECLAEPWMCETEPVLLPVAARPDEIDRAASRLGAAMQQAGVRCEAIQASVVGPSAFNRSLEQTGNKSVTCSGISFDLLRRVWSPGPDADLVVGDRHGGRMRYDQWLSETFGVMSFRISETSELSRYRLGASEVRFQCRAEEHFPVASASIVAKYMRELSMRQFNHFWQQKIPGLKATQGYPVDARRFAKDVETCRIEFGISGDVFWRVK